MLFMSSKNQPPKVLSHCQPSLHTLPFYSHTCFIPVSQHLGVFWSEQRYSAEITTVAYALEPFCSRGGWKKKTKGLPEVGQSKVLMSRRAWQGSEFMGKRRPWQIDSRTKSLITQPCLFRQSIYEQSTLSTNPTSHESGREAKTTEELT